MFEAQNNLIEEGSEISVKQSYIVLLSQDLDLDILKKIILVENEQDQEFATYFVDESGGFNWGHHFHYGNSNSSTARLDFLQIAFEDFISRIRSFL